MRRERSGLSPTGKNPCNPGSRHHHLQSPRLAVSLFRTGVYSVNLHDVTEVKISEES
jgi:hypothetical protein